MRAHWEVALEHLQHECECLMALESSSKESSSSKEDIHVCVIKDIHAGTLAGCL